MRSFFSKRNAQGQQSRKRKQTEEVSVDVVPAVFEGDESLLQLHAETAELLRLVKTPAKPIKKTNKLSTAGTPSKGGGKTRLTIEVLDDDDDEENQSDTKVMGGQNNRSGEHIQPPVPIDPSAFQAEELRIRQAKDTFYPDMLPSKHGVEWQKNAFQREQNRQNEIHNKERLRAEQLIVKKQRRREQTLENRFETSAVMIQAHSRGFLELTYDTITPGRYADSEAGDMESQHFDRRRFLPLQPDEDCDGSDDDQIAPLGTEDENSDWQTNDTLFRADGTKNSKLRDTIRSALHVSNASNGRQCDLHQDPKDVNRKVRATESALMCANWELDQLRRKYRAEEIQEIFMKQRASLRYDKKTKQYVTVIECRHPMYRALENLNTTWNKTMRRKLHTRSWFRSFLEQLRSDRLPKVLGGGEKAGNPRVHSISQTNNGATKSELLLLEARRFPLNRPEQTGEEDANGFRTFWLVDAFIVPDDVPGVQVAPTSAILAPNIASMNATVTTRVDRTYPFCIPTTRENTPVEFIHLLWIGQSSRNQPQAFTTLGRQQPGDFMKNSDPDGALGSCSSVVYRSWAYMQDNPYDEFVTEDGVAYWYDRTNGNTFWTRPVLPIEKFRGKDGGVDGVITTGEGEVATLGVGLGHTANGGGDTDAAKDGGAARYSQQNLRKYMTKKMEAPEDKERRVKLVTASAKKHDIVVELTSERSSISIPDTKGELTRIQVPQLSLIRHQRSSVTSRASSASSTKSRQVPRVSTHEATEHDDTAMQPLDSGTKEMIDSITQALGSALPALSQVGVAKGSGVDMLQLDSSGESQTAVDGFGGTLHQRVACLPKDFVAAVTSTKTCKMQANYLPIIKNMLLNSPDWTLGIDEKDSTGNTLLSVACQNNNKRIAKLCMRRGADINTQNLNGQSLLHYCHEYGFHDLMEYLMEKGTKDDLLNADGLTCYEGLSQDAVDAI
ncbi:hypothetical protein BBO99_00006363 [Phytophthora kernoviae]|uniref:Uncharacterized protein n=2 Tax=Phytophthora kernoviae TaxID=325452 RepID=A0A3R7KSH9_9STRA|nr:hypothetical protein G195_009652 [Phytophthora kernoviae 00238/432]KAG2523141.1 hypothetical protein JM18_005826 [Phytophthora kernoviae]RLN21518.1 hypothetical protein BBI17_005614 [Phytophthora kernoviae]RLN77920.1 hypothetical protein BBO99_00006363 [Phytophthora kernoviae]